MGRTTCIVQCEICRELLTACPVSYITGCMHVTMDSTAVSSVAGCPCWLCNPPTSSEAVKWNSRSAACTYGMRHILLNVHAFCVQCSKSSSTTALLCDLLLSAGTIISSMHGQHAMHQLLPPMLTPLSALQQIKVHHCAPWAGAVHRGGPAV